MSEAMVMPGTTVRWGNRNLLIGAVLWIGERYYMGVFSDGSVGLFPAADVERCSRVAGNGGS